MSSPVNWSIQIAYYTAAQWTAWDGVLKSGEEGHESDTGKRKIGDGTTIWSLLPYIFSSTGSEVQAGIIAHAGGGQGLATSLTGSICFVDTVSTVGDSVILLTGVQGTIQRIINRGANACDVFPQLGENFQGQSANIALSLDAGGILNCAATATGVWGYY